jgi:thioredoxin-related protein
MYSLYNLKITNTKTETIKMALLIKENGKVDFCTPLNKKFFTLDELQEKVGGLVEVIRIKAKAQPEEEYILVAHEESKFVEDHKINTQATLIADIMPNDYVSGDVILCKSAEVL